MLIKILFFFGHYVSRKQAIDQNVVRMIIKNCQPLSIVENEGFRELVHLLEPSYMPHLRLLMHLVKRLLKHCMSALCSLDCFVPPA